MGRPRGGRRCGLRRSGLACVRGGREVFSGLGFCRRRRRGPAGHRPQRRRQILAAADDRRAVRLAGGQLALAGGDPEQTIPEQAHYLGHQDALKPSLTVAENLAFWAALSRRRGRRRERRSRPSGWRRWPTCRPPTCRPASGGGCRIARLVAVQRPIWLLDEPTSALDREAQDMLAGLMRQHLAGGGLIVAAAHGPIGLDRAKELRLGRRRHEPRSPALFMRDMRLADPRRRRRADRRAVLPDRRDADAVRDRARPRAARAASARRSSGSARCSRSC